MRFAHRNARTRSSLRKYEDASSPGHRRRGIIMKKIRNIVKHDFYFADSAVFFLFTPFDFDWVLQTVRHIVFPDGVLRPDVDTRPRSDPSSVVRSAHSCGFTCRLRRGFISADPRQRDLSVLSGATELCNRRVREFSLFYVFAFDECGIPTAGKNITICYNCQFLTAALNPPPSRSTTSRTISYSVGNGQPPNRIGKLAFFFSIGPFNRNYSYLSK